DPGYPELTIDIFDTGLFVYKLHEPGLVERRSGFHGNYFFMYCGHVVEGYAEDRYEHGNLRLRGNFVKGKPKDSLVSFYSNGVVKRRIHFLAKELLIEDFDSLSRLIKISHNSNKRWYLTDYHWKEFYPNGKIKLIESSVDRLVISKEYYANGNLKKEQTRNHRLEFYPDKKLMRSWYWKVTERNTIGKTIKYDRQISMTKFDEHGKLLESFVCEEWNSAFPQPDLILVRSYWIIKWTKWKNGRPVVIAEDISTEDFLKELFDSCNALEKLC
ncbi:MAG TPA: hypothetical protein VKH37_06415, partial [Ferruginibacter sp.]|nr:hypothetical protein [Ferruginibacter sp.]